MKFLRSQRHTVIVGAVSTFHLYPSQLDDPRREIAPEARLGAGFDVHGTGPTAEIGIRVTRRDVASRIHVEPGLKSSDQAGLPWRTIAALYASAQANPARIRELAVEAPPWDLPGGTRRRTCVPGYRCLCRV